MTVLESRKTPYLLLGVSLALILFFSLPTLTTAPRIWTDEGVITEVARTYGTWGVLDLEVAPGVFGGKPHLYQATGFPVTVPLGFLFDIVGFSFSLARLYMVGWLIIAVIASFYFIKYFFEAHFAGYAVLLLTTFASFYGTGRNVIGEVPGFVFLLAGLFLLIGRKQYVLSGLFLCLAIACKPSVFLLILPAVLLFLLAYDRSKILKKSLMLFLGAVPVALVWLSFVTPNPFQMSFWQELVAFYQQPFAGSSVSANVARNLSTVFQSTTLIYFGAWLICLIFVRMRTFNKKLKGLYDVTLLYSFLAFLYYLRSPGWLRYILIAELLLLIFLPHILFVVSCFLQKKIGAFRRIPVAYALALALFSLALIQTVQFYTAAEIYHDEKIFETARILDERFAGKSVFVLNSPGLYVLLENPLRETYIDIQGPIPIGSIPLTDETPDTRLPDVLVTGTGGEFPKYKNFIMEHYTSSGEINSFSIYTRGIIE